MASYRLVTTLRRKVLTPLDSGFILRYAARDDARTHLETSGWAELVVGAAFFFFPLFGAGEG